MSFSLMTPILAIWRVCYILVQHLVILLYKPPPPANSEEPRNPYARIVVIGAGLTGVSSAAHCIAHNFEVVIFEAAPREGLGGIWSQVNKTSGLQINSHLYRFHPGVLWRNAFPERDEILGEITRIWKEYHLEPRTRFNTPVTSVRRVESVSGTSHWLVNDGKEGPFDAIICNVGTCGKPKWLDLEGMPNRDANSDGDVFTKTMIHSSQLDSEAVAEETIKGKKVVVIGSGASGVEAVEAALERGAGEVVMIARTDKWIIPRNIFFDTFLACQPFGREMPLSFIWESFLKRWQYHGVDDLVPEDRGLFEDTPVVNSNFLPHVRSRACTYVRGDPIRLTSSGVRVNVRERGTKPESLGEEETIEADVVVFATGYEKPSIGFLAEDKLFPDGYERPDLYLQNFSTEDWTVLMTNSAYMSAIGTVGHFHIGIYTRILLTLLLDPDARPSSKDMKLWVDVVRFIKRGAKGGALGFFTYAELTIWLVTFHLLRPDRLKWLFFIMCGWGVHAPATKTKSKVKGKKAGRYRKKSSKDKVDSAEGVKEEEVKKEEVR